MQLIEGKPKLLDQVRIELLSRPHNKERKKLY